MEDLPNSNGTALVPTSQSRPKRARWLVHVGLIGFVITSLVFEPVLALHVVLADGFLFIITSAMLASGFWDLWAPHPTKIRWHAITGVVLAIYVAVHTVRRWRRLRFSEIR
jgi:hypothetical protein